MHSRREVLAGVALLIAGGCGAPGWNGPRERATTLPAAGEPGAAAAPPEFVARRLQPAMNPLGPTRTVESYRIEPKRGDDSAVGILGYPILVRGPLLDGGAARRLRALVLDPRGYNGDLWCGEIQPGVAFRFVGGEKVLTVLVCFKCNQWEFWLDGERVLWDWFVGLQPELLRLAQQTFPGDEALRAIAPSESYGRVYRVDALRAGSGAPNRDEVVAAWGQKIMDAVGDYGRRRDNGGSTHFLRKTEDGTGFIVVTTARGHAATASLDGIRVVSPQE